MDTCSRAPDGARSYGCGIQSGRGSSASARAPELLFRLKSKEGEVLELLRRADVYADENRSQTDVHGAMADTLAEAWRDLNDKLQYRSKLLEQSVTFHQSAQDLSSKLEQAQGNFIGVPLASDVDSARRLLQQHNDMKQTILESSKFTLDLGQSLLDQIKEMGMHADIQNRHATTAACYGIEHLLELLHDKRRHLEELWTQRKIQLEQCLHLCQLDQEVNKILEWFRTVGTSYLTRTELGTSYNDSKRIQEEHSQFEAEAREIQENMLRLLRTADSLLRRTNIDAEGIRQRLMLVDQECENFMIKLDNRRKNIFMAVSFFNLAETALNKLDQVEVQLNNMDLPRNSAELAERHSQLSNAIVDVSTEAIHEGRLLLERVSSVDPGADGVRRKLDELHSRCTHLESLCKARRAEAWQRSQAYLHFQENYNSLSTWLSQIGHSMLARHSSMGTSLASAKDFLEVHEQLDEDIRDKNADLEALSSAAMALVKSGDQEAKNAAERADALHKQFTRLQRIVETRIQLALIYVSFLKLVQQLSTSLDSLQHIIRSETEDLQDLTDTALQQVQTMYTQTEQLFAEFNAKGKLFLQNSSTIADDSRLEVRTAISLVESSLTEYGQRMTSLTQYWEAWQQHVISSKQFKSQWHQFIQDARRTIDHVMKIEREFFLPYIAGNLGNSLQKAQELQRKLTEFIPIAKKAQEDIEEHLKTAELLSLKGDTRGQKEQIVNELIRVHQRFQARMNEYQILIKMTIQFFKNVSQLDELIEKTEREYMQSQLPTDLSQAESMLEEHKRKKTEVSHFINYTAEEGDKIVRRVRQQDAEAAAREDVQQVLDVMTEYRRRWDSTWEEQERRLRQNLQICQFHYDLRQIHSEIDELHQHLQARRGSYGNSLPAAKMTAQAFNQFEKTVELIERKIKDFISTAELMVQDKHYDSENIHREIDVLKKKWSTFHTSVRDYRTQLNTSVLYFTLIEECEIWMREGSQLLINIGRRAPECRAPQDAADLIQSLERFVEQGKPLQEQRLQKISELSLQLYGDQGANKVRPLIIQYQDIMQSFEQADNELSLLKENLEGKQAPPIEETMDRQTAAAAAAPRAQPKPPRITQHLKNAEVVEGVKFTFECRVESETVPEVRWFKDNLPLNSPDYETHYDRGLATLTIEETFSEDTARYTCRFTSQSGMAESSAYLTVRAMRPPVFQQPLHDITAPEGKSVHFEVRFTGSPAPDVAWFRGPKRILPSATYKITIEANFSSLDIREAYAEDSDTYTVIIKNMGGEVRSSCKLTIESVFSSPVEDLSQVSTDVEPQRPMFTQLLSPTKDVPEGARVRLDCVLVGHPEPEVIWLKNEKPVKESQDIQLLFEGDHCTLVSVKQWARTVELTRS
ncbi:coiled-coil domain-containing protein 141-like isoform X3 [Pomacea canaliculata]|uniref:coiled-coil domain-containing protein 141-like isoform X3 n=1 Tax=Pomacea canaliculata TaxID=400727 RepID=UPI000D7343FF|nr:coiled-coil domain-containing protein 141-like isoform X3 [Pomacea canaliculata]